uniref:Surfeit locus protein 6 n=1 Tax=Schistocephalus solidus TaxID=70667 RepID=A0A0X3Q5Y6_SCHSO
MCSDFYFSNIEVFDKDELLNQVVEQKERRKEIRRSRKLEKYGIFTGNDSVKTLQKARAFEQQLETIQKEDPEKAMSVNQRRSWLLARLKAQGVKVKTDISRLKKSARKSEALKRRSSKNWKQRIDQVVSSKDAKQKKRDRNLQNRRDSKRAKKYKKLVKKGHILPQLQQE